MKTPKQRLSNVVGQIEGIKSMLDTKYDCVSILTQLKAVSSAINAVSNQIVSEQFDTCLKSLTKSDKDLLLSLKKYVKNN